jgi:hypothetical protein
MNMNTKWIVPFRPSSHSYDGTIVLRFENEKKADAAARISNNGRGYRSAVSHGKLLLIIISDGGVDEPDDTLEELGWKGDYEEYACYQELTVNIAIPVGATPEALALVLGPTQATLFQELTRLCKQTKITETEETKTISFSYNGEAIYKGKQNGKYVFVLSSNWLHIERTGVEVVVHI